MGKMNCSMYGVKRLRMQTPWREVFRLVVLLWIRTEIVM
jgi:hypothetical protein